VNLQRAGGIAADYSKPRPLVQEFVDFHFWFMLYFIGLEEPPLGEDSIGAWRLIGIGWVFVTCIVLGLAVGIWLDSLTGRSPLATLIGLFIGIGAGFTGMFRMISSVYGEDNKLRKH